VRIVAVLAVGLPRFTTAADDGLLMEA